MRIIKIKYLWVRISSYTSSSCCSRRTNKKTPNKQHKNVCSKIFLQPLWMAFAAAVIIFKYYYNHYLPRKKKQHTPVARLLAISQLAIECFRVQNTEYTEHTISRSEFVIFAFIFWQCIFRLKAFKFPVDIVYDWYRHTKHFITSNIFLEQTAY